MVPAALQRAVVTAAGPANHREHGEYVAAVADAVFAVATAERSRANELRQVPLFSEHGSPA